MRGWRGLNAQPRDRNQVPLIPKRHGSQKPAGMSYRISKWKIKGRKANAATWRRVCAGPFPGRLGYSLARVGPWGVGGLEPTGGRGEGAQIMELEAGSAAQRGRQSTSRVEGALTAARRIQVSPAETRPPDMVKIAQTLLIGNTPDRAWTAPRHLVGFAEQGPCCVLAWLQAPRMQGTAVDSGLREAQQGPNWPSWPPTTQA